MHKVGLEHVVIDNKEDGLFRVHRRVFTDPEILALEHRRVSQQFWIYAGHASEVPEAGDCVTRNIG